MMSLYVSENTLVDDSCWLENPNFCTFHMICLHLRVRLARVVYPLIESAQDNLSEVEASRVGLARRHQFREEIRGDRGAVFVVAAHLLERLLLPYPIFQHL